jgi:hypothetical protein
MVTACRNVAAMAATLICGSATAVTGQFPPPSQPRDVGVTAAFGVNVLLGGVTAATRALIERHDPVRAFALGAFGGAMHFGAKLMGPRTSLAGVAVGATGTAIIVNAGRGVSPLDELYVPIGPLRVRITPRAPRKLHVGLNAYNVAVLARNLARPGLVMDWGRTGSSGTFVLRTDDRRIWDDDREYAGVAVGSLIVLSEFSANRQVTHHELIHVHQYLFVDEAIGRPIEQYLRRRVPGARWLPRWIELGIVTPALGALDQGIFGRDGLAIRLGESEAEMVAGCC